MKNKMALALILIFIFSLTSCGSDSGGGSSSVNSLSDIARVWDWSDNYGNGIVDEYYIHFSESGSVSGYDYDGDNYDQGSDCYYIDRNWDTITHVSGNTFNSSLAGEFDASINSDGALVLTQSSGTSDVYPKTSITAAEMDAKECFASRPVHRKSFLEN